MSKVCLVIGVGPGIGLALVKKWSAEGFKVAAVAGGAEGGAGERGARGSRQTRRLRRMTEMRLLRKLRGLSKLRGLNKLRGLTGLIWLLYMYIVIWLEHHGNRLYGVMGFLSKKSDG